MAVYVGVIPQRLALSVFFVLSAAATGIDATYSPTEPPQQEQRRFPPPDDSTRDPDFAKFRNALLIAASRGDVAAILAATADTVRLPEETRLSAAEFLKQQGVQQGVSWKALREALTLGAVSVSYPDLVGFVAPYLGVAQGLDLGERVAMGHNVRLRDAPSPTARVRATLDYLPVRVLNDHVADFESLSTSKPSSWAHVRTDSGETGYVFVGLLKSGGEGRFYFARINGAWKLVAWYDGD